MSNFDLFADETTDSVPLQCTDPAADQESENKEEALEVTTCAEPAVAAAAADNVADEPKPEVKEGKSEHSENEKMIEAKSRNVDEKENKISEIVEEAKREEKDKENLPPPPPPPKRSSQTNQRLKRWSKMLKHTLPNKLPKVSSSASASDKESKNNSSQNKDRKSLKDKVMEGELAVFLKERRAVSESRFRILDKLTSGGSARPPLPRTKSNDVIKKPQPVGGRYIGKMRRTSGSRGRTWGNEIQPGTLNNLKEIFESKSASCSMEYRPMNLFLRLRREKLTSKRCKSP